MSEFESVAEPEAAPMSPATAGRNARVGLRLFLLYSLVYAVFIAINAFRPEWMDWTPWAGLNLAVLYGFGLIFGAFLLALVYGWLCRNPVDEAAGEESPP